MLAALQAMDLSDDFAAIEEEEENLPGEDAVQEFDAQGLQDHS